MRLLLLLFAFSALSASSAVLTSASAAEPQWIWRHQDAATKAEQETVYFRKTFDVEQPDGGSIEITADNSFEVYLNGRRLGSGDNWRQRFKFDIGPVLVPGRNVIAVAADNSAADAAGLAVRVVAKHKGQAPVEVASDDSWKWSLKVPGTWARLESDDSQWEAAAVLGPYGQTAPWGAAGQIVEGKPAVPVLTKPRSREKGLFEFRDGDRVVFLGSGFIERLQNTGYLETMITAAFPHKKITFRNLGWSGDTVWGDARAGFGTRADGFARLVSDVAMCDPTVLIICYGENEAYAGEAGLDEFRSGLNALLDVLERTGARIVLLGPRQHENLGPPLPNPAKYNADLRKYNDVIGQVAKEREHWFVDLYSGAVRTDGTRGPRTTENGIHLDPNGESLVSTIVATELGVVLRPGKILIDFEKSIVDTSEYTVLSANRNESNVEVVVRRAALSVPWYSDGGLIPVDQIPTLTIRGLQDGQYFGHVNGHKPPVGTDREGLSEGLPLHLFPSDNAVYRLRETVNEKNTLFFHRYRPQNETYLLLFRKHEQGNNAVEIPQFDPLIEELEQKIDELKKPVKQKFELVKVK